MRILLLPLALFLPLAAQEAEIPPDKDKQTTPSGLVYSVLSPGRPGPHPGAHDVVRVHYTGWLPDGKVFGSTRKRGQPVRVAMDRVIRGWAEALRLMTPGARWKLTIPPKLAYGARGRPGRIPPNATLVFEVELVEVIPVPPFVKPDPKAQKTTPSGLKYEVLAEGAGTAPGEGDTYELQYVLWNAQGKLLDTSLYRDQPLTGTCGEMRLAFLNEAPKLMKPGARFRFEVPPKLAFGAQNRGPDLPPNTVTIWELRLLKVLKPLPLPKFARPEGEGVETTKSGLKIQVLKAGTGARPRDGDEVRVHYAGWLTDGKLFDASYKRGKPATFRVGRLIPGWNEALQRMQVGGVYLLEIPPNLAYGPRGVPGIPPNATLVFRVELLGLKHAP